MLAVHPATYNMMLRLAGNVHQEPKQAAAPAVFQALYVKLLPTCSLACICQKQQKVAATALGSVVILWFPQNCSAATTTINQQPRVYTTQFVTHLAVLQPEHTQPLRATSARSLGPSLLLQPGLLQDQPTGSPASSCSDSCSASCGSCCSAP